VVAYLGVFGVAGSVYSTWLAPLTALWLALTVVAMAWRARGRYGPVLLGGAAAVILLAGKFVLGQPALVFAGIAALLGAAVWRAWPHPDSIECDECVKEKEIA
jgi:hypothetical protein